MKKENKDHYFFIVKYCTCGNKNKTNYNLETSIKSAKTTGSENTTFVCNSCFTGIPFFIKNRIYQLFCCGEAIFKTSGI